MAALTIGRSTIRSFLLSAMAVLSVTTTTTYAAKYVVSQILKPAPLSSSAKAINKAGKVSGTRIDSTYGAYSSTRTSKAYIFSNHSSLNLSGPSGASDGVAINGAGQVAGNAAAGVYQHAMLWTNGLYRDLGLLPGTTNSAAYGINDLGVVVGSSGSYPFIWQNGVMSQLGSATGFAYSINSLGVVAGSANSTPVMWDINGNAVPLATTAGEAYRVNDSGQIVGYVNTNGSKGFLWQNGALQILPLPTGVISSQARSLNDLGAIVGYGSFTTAPYTRALLWEDNIAMDLNSLIPADSGWVLARAWDINTAGQIVGEGTFNGSSQAFLLSPSGLTGAPITRATANGTAGCAGWFTSPVTVNLLAIDNSGSGVKEIRYSVDGAAELVVPGLSADILVSGDRIHTIAYYAVDNSGQVETVKTFTVTIDGTLPASVATISGTAGVNGWYRSSVTAQVSGTDITSGVASIKYRKNTNGLWGSTVTAPNPVSIAFGNLSTIAANGRFKLGFNAVDRACNAEIEKVVDVNIDTTAPNTTFAASPAGNINGWANNDVTVTFNAVDSVSGIDFLALNGVATLGSTVSYLLGEGTSTFTYGATDKAGNIELVKSVTFRVDKTVPIVSVSTSPATLIATSKSKLVPVTITGSATDNLSGVGTVVITVTDEYGLYNQTVAGFGTGVTLDTYKKKNDGNGRVYTIKATVTDLAGNQSTSTYSLIVK